MLSTFELLTLTKDQKESRIWLSGIEGEGELLAYGVCKESKRNGEYKFYYSGRLREHCFYKNDLKHGSYRLYGKDGDLLQYIVYNKGVRIKTILDRFKNSCLLFYKLIYIT